MHKFFNPKSIALIGASNKKGKVGYSLVNNLKTFRGKVFYINIRDQKINNKKSINSLIKIKSKIDLAIVCTPAITVPRILKDCIENKIKNIILISAGFKESKNKYLEKEIKEIINKNKLNVLGPNCFGVFNASNKLDATFAKEYPNKGSTAFISQSGALWSYISEISYKLQLGFSKFISFGDMINVDFNQALQYLIKDRSTKQIIAYIESIKNGKEFIKIAKKTKKPIIVIKGGKTKEGEKASLSHTGKITTEYAIYKAAFKKAGIYYVETVYEALILSKFFQLYKKPTKKRTLIMTNAGGPGIICTDLITKNNLKLAKIPKTLQLPIPYWQSQNPIDVLGDANQQRISKVFQILKKKSFYDYLVVLITPQEMTSLENIAEDIVSFYKKTKKPVICAFLGDQTTKYSKAILKNHKILELSRIEDITNLLKNLSQY